MSHEEMGHYESQKYLSESELAYFQMSKKISHQIYQNGALRFNSGIFQIIGGKYGSSKI